MLKPPPDFNERAYQLKVQGDISHDVDLVALLRSHLNIEQCLDRVILHNVPDGKPHPRLSAVFPEAHRHY